MTGFDTRSSHWWWKIVWAPDYVKDGPSLEKSKNSLVSHRARHSKTSERVRIRSFPLVIHSPCPVCDQNKSPHLSFYIGWVTAVFIDHAHSLIVDHPHQLLPSSSSFEFGPSHCTGRSAHAQKYCVISLNNWI